MRLGLYLTVDDGERQLHDPVTYEIRSSEDGSDLWYRGARVINSWELVDLDSDALVLAGPPALRDAKVSEAKRFTRPGGYDHAVHGNRIHGLLYELMRDGLASPGRLHEMVEDLAGCEVYTFSNDFLAAYAIFLNGRLNGIDGEAAMTLAHDAIRHAQGRPE